MIVSVAEYDSYPSLVAVIVTCPTGTPVKLQPPALPVVLEISVPCTATATPSISLVPSDTFTLISTVVVSNPSSILFDESEVTPLQYNQHQHKGHLQGKLIRRQTSNQRWLNILSCGRNIVLQILPPLLDHMQ